MHIHRPDLDRAAQSGVISPSQAQALWTFWAQETPDTPRFRTSHVLYYLGGLLALAAMTLLVTTAWNRLGAWGLIATSLSYGAIALTLCHRLQHHPHWIIPAGLMAGLVVALTPMAIYGLQALAGWWPIGTAYRDYHRLIDGRWMLMELGTLAVGAAMLWRYRLAFIMLPVAITLWAASMDLAPLLAEHLHDVDQHWLWRYRISMVAGALMVLLGFLVDLRLGRRPDFAFWLYVIGVMVFWGGMTQLLDRSDWGWVIRPGVDLILIALGVVLNRRVFVVFGAIGTSTWLYHLASVVFRDSAWFPLILSLLGLAIVGVGIWWQRHEAVIQARLQGYLPAALRDLLSNAH